MVEIIPEFAVVGHPNEGKSAVVSTLTENDTVRVTPHPGETIICQTFPVTIDGQEIIRFTDTPGFQNPKKTLAWMRDYRGEDLHMLKGYLDAHSSDPDFKDDCELLKPVAEGAGVIYIVDGSRPIRSVDLNEMEILRLTGRPRMAIINCKEEEASYLDQWKTEFRKHFNAIRVFNANRATYAERIDLLENLKGIDQDWGPALETVIEAFKKDWQRRNFMTAEVICDLLDACLTYSITKNYNEITDDETLKKSLQNNYNKAIEKIEKKAHQRIRKLYKHNIFNYVLPPQSILNEDLFSEKTWQFLGLTSKQLITAAGMAGGAVGAALDVAAAGLTFGVFTTIGGLLGAGWAALGGGKRLAKAKMVGLNLGGQQITVGPTENIQFVYILLDRCLIYYSHVINWAHGRRDYPSGLTELKSPTKAGLAFQWDEKIKSTCQSFVTAIRKDDDQRKVSARKKLKGTLQEILEQISYSDQRYGLIT